MKNSDKLRYLELLKKEEEFYKHENNKFFGIERPDEADELVKYFTILNDQFYYNQKENYRSLIQDYQSGEFSTIGFILAFFEMYRQDAKNFEILRMDFKELLSFPIDAKSEGFSSFLDDIFDNGELFFNDCQAVDLDPNAIKNYGPAEDQFRGCIEVKFSKMQKYFQQ